MCDNECKICMEDPDSNCAVNNKEVWDRFYEPLYKKCIEKKVYKNSNCDNIKKMKRIFLNNHLKNF